MILFGNPDLETCKILSRQAEKEVSALFRRPNKMEFEKIYFPYLLFAKKRYAGRKFEFTFKNGQEVTTQKQDAKGIETVRRDSIPLTKEVVQKILDTVLVAKEPRVAEDGTLLPADYTPEIQKAVKIAQDVVRDVYLNKIELGKVVITKAYSKERHEYMSPQPHIELAYRMSLRDPLTAPNKGTRVPYVVRKGNKEDKVWQKSEDPIYALRNGIPIDSEYYLEMLRKPLLRIFDPLIGEDQARSRIFTGEHTFNRAVAAMTTVPSFLQGDNGVTIHKRNKQCLVCKAVLHRGTNTCKNQAVCIHCSAEKERVADVFIDKIEAFNDSHVRHDRLKNWCLQCQGDLTAPVGCSNTDCGIYYLRFQYQSEFERARDDMMRFDLSW
uniref:DNA-directed DNA polymerase n=1 Tax=Clandestinovirus TaxID=2831644 RepID=A0A8F8KP41_9VIRU|nr:replicative polymerase delta family B [Clandestinovirus]